MSTPGLSRNWMFCVMSSLKKRSDITNIPTNGRRLASNTTGGKGRKKTTAPKRPRLSENSTTSGEVNLNGIWYSPTRPPSSSNLDMGKFGLKRINYKKVEAPVWTLPPSPPTKSVQERVVFPATLVIVAGFMLWVYMNPEEDDMTEYWKRVESGQVLMDIDDDDDDDYDDWDDDEEDED